MEIAVSQKNCSLAIDEETLLGSEEFGFLGQYEPELTVIIKEGSQAQRTTFVEGKIQVSF